MELGCPMCKKTFKNEDEFVTHVKNCRDERRRTELVKERDRRYQEVKDAYAVAGKAFEKCGELESKLRKDFPNEQFSFNGSNRNSACIDLTVNGEKVDVKEFAKAWDDFNNTIRERKRDIMRSIWEM